MMVELNEPKNMIDISPGASHPATNKVIYELLTHHLGADGSVLDFGTGQGYMVQKLGQYFKGLGKEPSDHVFACEIDPDNFKYDQVQCEKISVNSDIPFEDKSFDVIYAVEVLEHTPRPYDFFLNAYDKLREGGVLIFSTPNILHFKSRLSFLLGGYPEMYGPLSIKDENAGRVCGHIMPLSYSNFHYGLRKAGFGEIEFHVDRKKKGAIIPALLMYPLLRYFSYREKKKLKDYDLQVYAENSEVVPFMNSIDILSSRSAIIVAKKM